MGGNGKVGPLTGLRGMDFSRTLAGVLSGTIMADLGAEIIMVEVPSKGGHNKREGAHLLGGKIDARGNYNSRAKKSIVLDVNQPKGKELFLKMVPKLDIVQNNWRVGTAERIGVDYASLSKINPRVIACSITGYGSKGPYAKRGSFDTVAAAHTGLMGLIGTPGVPPGSPPGMSSVPVLDYATAVWASHGMLSAVIQRERTGRGQHVEVSLYEVGLSMQVYFATDCVTNDIMPAPRTLASEKRSLSGLYQTSDGYIAVGVMSERHYAPFCRALDKPEWIDDQRFITEAKRMRNKGALQEMARNVVLQKPAEHWVERLVKEQVPVSAVCDMKQALHNPQTEALGCLVNVTSAEGKPMKVVRSPVTLSDYQPTYSPITQVGQHTEEILQDILGLSSRQVRELEEAGIVKTAKAGVNA